MKNRNKKSHIGSLAIFSSVLVAVGCVNDDLDSTNGDLVQPKKITGTLDDNADVNSISTKLDSILPSWSSKIATVPESIAKSSFFEEKNALSIASQFSKTSMSFEKSTTTGKALYSSADGEEAVLTMQESGFWKYITSPEETKADKSNFTDKDALAQTLEMFDSFKLPNNEKSSGFIATGVGEADMGPDGIISERKVTGRHVRLFREINGIRVWGSRLMATYNLEGKPFRVEVNWPPFRLNAKASGIQDRKTAVKILAEEIAQEYSSLDDIKEINSQLVYKYNEDIYAYDPVVFVFIRPKDDDRGPRTIEYSLIDGLDKSEIIPESNDVEK